MTTVSMSDTAAGQEVHVFPASFAQQRLWFLDQLEPHNPTYNLFHTVRISVPLDVEVLERSLHALVQRYEILRTIFIAKDGQPMQVIAPTLSVPLARVDLQSLPEAKREAEALRLANEQAQQPFDLARGPLLRTILLRLGAQEHVLLLVIHHIIFDGWSSGVFFRELATLYQAFATDQPASLPDLPIQYADFAVWQREWLQGELLEGQLVYWKEQLAQAPDVLQLPTDHARPALPSSRGSSCPFALSASLTAALKALSQQEGVSLFMTLVAALQTLLSRYSGQEDLLLGMATADRGQAEIENLLGFFVNTLVLRTDLSGDPSFRELLGRVREVVLQAHAHQDVPFEHLVKELRPARSLGRNPFFQVMIALEPGDPDLPSGWALNQMDVKTDTARFDLSLRVEDRPDGLLGCFEYSSDLFEEATMSRLVGHWQALLEGIVAHPEQHLSALPLLTEAERQQMLVEWNATEVEYPDKLCVHQLFEAQVERTPDAQAVAFENEHLTYRELNNKANQLACHLQQLGVGPEVLVGLYMERSLEMVVALLGILKAGGAYVPLDPTFPSERLGFIFADTQMPVLVTQHSLVVGLPEHNAHVICLDTDWDTIARRSKANVSSGVKGENAVYVIYTSGSTGKPKGVTVEHKQLSNYLNGIVQRLEIPAGSSFATVSTLATDLGNTVIFPSLCTGGCLHMVSRERAIDPRALGDYFSKHPIDCLKITPSHLAALQASSQTGQIMPRRRLIIGGEAFSWEWVNGLQTLAPYCTIFNHYGPTETTVGVLTYRLQKEQGAPGYTMTPMGRPIGNTQVYLLDKYQQPVPIGVSGELYIGGASVARGYLNRPELTAEKFIADPFNTELGARLYRTGDLARFLPNGNIEFQGRIDDQVKIRGYRIELGEIQETLSNHPAVRTALVVVREDVPGDKRLVAYVVLHEGQKTTAADLQSHMMKHVPNYMVPSAFMLLESFPLMPNGKVDRRALLAPDYSHRELEPGFLAPQTPLQEAVAASWSKVLGIEQIGIHDDFFTLGGHSLLAMQVISHLRTTLQLELPLRSFFEAPTIEHLADALLKEGDTHGKGETDSRAKVVTIQAGGARRPFFYLHGDWLGGGLYCLGLTESLSKDQPFYTLEPYRFDGLQIPPTLEAMAATHIEAMRTVQPEGPYLLGGWCNGGLIAYEMARQLNAAGQAVDLLVAIDMGTPYSHKLNRKMISRIGNLFGLGQEKQLNWFLRYIYLRIPSFRKRIQEDAGLKITKQAESGQKMGFAFSKFKSIFPTIEALRYNWFGIFRWIKAGYEPGRYSGKLTLFWSDEADPHDIDWRKLSGAKEVEDHFFPGTHVMYRNENLSVLAECLDACLIEAQATESSARS